MNAFDYHWKNYLIAGGYELVELFDKAICGDFSVLKNINDEIKRLHLRYCPSKVIVDECYENIDTLIKQIENNSFFSVFEPGKKYTAESGLKCLETVCREDNKDLTYGDKDIIEYFCSNISYESFSMALQFPDIFIPYFFHGNFNIVSFIATEFEIELPPVPPKKDYLKRFYYYGEICDAFEKFRFENNLSAAELWAFLYDFAPNCVGLKSYIKTQLPTPKSAFLIGSGPKDVYLNEDIALWQCNPDTRAGDMIVMYITSPQSRIKKIWRSISSGFNDPFFYYYRCTYIGEAKQIDGMTLTEMAADKMWGELPIVHKKMQGVNGTEISPEIYNYLLDRAKSKILKIAYRYKQTNVKIENEHDVEVQLIEPLLERLGWSKGDYIAQMYVPLGSGKNRLVADYAILPDETPHREKALYIIEAKKSITSQKQLEEVKGQARSYARQLWADKSVIASEEGIWISARSDDYDKTIFECSWSELSENGKFQEIQRLIGKNT
ncbi:MAG: hypothetical protein NC078_11655 [Ruminococcus sp.]|nr:hypothetical protein [Ruminococcus sp.]